MGLYINTGNAAFRAARNGEYVDKSVLIDYINTTLNSQRQFSCVSRARRFGKSMVAAMLNAYYDQSCDSYDLFADLDIASKSSFNKHLNKYPVIYIDMTDFISQYNQNAQIVRHMQSDVIADLKTTYSDIDLKEEETLMRVLMKIVQHTGKQFIVIIDEWDAICREFTSDDSVMSEYVMLLRGLFKSIQAMKLFAGVYMTGILPIKKYNTQSALNNFVEYSMIEPGALAPYFGFTKNEVKRLCDKYQFDFEELVKWYDGYKIGFESDMFNPTSVMTAIYNKHCGNYWSKTASYQILLSYIQLNFDGLKNIIIRLLAGDSCFVNTTIFQNDLKEINSSDDVLTALIHLGYLSYNRHDNKCYIPNCEVAGEFTNAISQTNWNIVANAVDQSDRLLKLVLDGNETAVSQMIDTIHSDNTSILQYNDENSLACVLAIAFYAAKNYYTLVREIPAGKGFADIVMIPFKNVDMPAIVLELKYNQSAITAIDQIKQKHYSDALNDYFGEVVLVGINYNKQTKEHSCLIERVIK